MLAATRDSGSLAVRFKLLLVVALHHIILATIGDNKICCTPARTHTHRVENRYCRRSGRTEPRMAWAVCERRICIVSAMFFWCVCAVVALPLAVFGAAVEWGGLLKNHYANNIHTPSGAGAVAVLWVRRNGV